MPTHRTDAEHRQIVKMWLEGYGAVEIARTIKCSTNTVYRWTRHLTEGQKHKICATPGCHKPVGYGKYFNCDDCHERYNEDDPDFYLPSSIGDVDDCEYEDEFLDMIRPEG